MFVIPATEEVELGGIRNHSYLGDIRRRITKRETLSERQLKQKGLRVWLKW
jgi:hypothetical protein